MGIFKNLFPTNIKQQTAREYNETFIRSISTALNLPQTTDKESLVTNGYQKNATVFSIVNYINNSAASVPIKVYKIKDKGAFKDYSALMKGFNENALIKATTSRMRALQPAQDTELQKLLDRPNKDMGYFQWMQEVNGFLQITGDSFIWSIERKSGDKLPFELHTLPAQYMEIVLQNNSLNPIKGYEFKITGNESKVIPYDQMGHVKTFNPDWSLDGSHLYGQSPLTASNRNLIINNEAIDTGRGYLKNQGVRGILSSDDMGMLSKEQSTQLKDAYRKKYQGADRAGDIMITNHMFKWINMGLPATDVALLEQYDISKKDIAAAYNFPYLLLGNIEDFNNSNYREAKKQMYLQKIIPDLCLIRDELNRWLTPKFGDDLYIDFDYTVIPELQEDMEKVTKQLNVSWWITPNEKRLMQSLPELEKEGMDDIFVPANMINMSTDALQGELQGGDPMQRLMDDGDYKEKNK